VHGVKIALAVLAVGASAAAIVFGVLYFADDSNEKTVVVKPCGERTYGHVRSLVRKDGRWELKFDPAWFTSGITANTAAAEDGAVEPGQPVPNDNYVVDESKRELTYYVAPHARVTVLTNNTRILSTPIPVSELATIVAKGKSPQHRLFESLNSGVWIRVHIDTVCALDQQYRP
jgi:hypothetical protein